MSIYKFRSLICILKQPLILKHECKLYFKTTINFKPWMYFTKIYIFFMSINKFRYLNCILKQPLILKPECKLYFKTIIHTEPWMYFTKLYIFFMSIYKFRSLNCILKLPFITMNVLYQIIYIFSCQYTSSDF